MKCGNCGNEYHDSFDFCPDCGQKAPERPPTSVVCLNCGYANAVGEEFCRQCGNLLAAGDSAEPQSPLPPPSDAFAYREAPYQQPPYQQPPYQQPVVYVKAPNSGKATASLVLGICGLVVCPIVCSILAIVFALDAKKEIARSGGRIGGAGMAQAGLILGIVGLGFMIISGIYLALGGLADSATLSYLLVSTGLTSGFFV